MVRCQDFAAQVYDRNSTETGGHFFRVEPDYRLGYWEDEQYPEAASRVKSYQPNCREHDQRIQYTFDDSSLLSRFFRYTGVPSWVDKIDEQQKARQHNAKGHRGKARSRDRISSFG